MAEQAYAYVTLIPVAKGFQSAIAKELGGVGGVGGSAGQSAGKSFAGGFGGALKGLLGPITATLSTVAVANFAKSAVNAASSFSAEFEGVNQIFGSAAKSVQDFADNAANTVGISETAALQAAKNFGVFASSAGLVGEEAAGFSTKLVQAAGDLASFNDVPVEETLAAIRSGLQGQGEPLSRFGILMNEQILRQKAFDEGITNSIDQALTPQQRVLAANALVLGELGVAQGDFVNYSGTYGNAVKTVTATFEDLKSEVGQALIPALEQLLPAFLPIIDQAAPILLELFEALAPVIQTVTENIAPLFAALQPLFDALNLIITALGPIISELLPIFVELVGMITPIILQLVEAFLPLVEKMLPSFMGLLESLMPILEMVGEFISILVIPALELLGSIVGDVLIGAMNLLTDAFKALKDILGPVWDFLKPIIEGLLALAGIKPSSLSKNVKISTTAEDARLSRLNPNKPGSLAKVPSITDSLTTPKGTAKPGADIKKQVKGYIQETQKALISAKKDYNKAVDKANAQFAEREGEIYENYNIAVAKATIQRDADLARALKDNTKRVSEINADFAKRLDDIVKQSMNRLRDAYRSAVEINVASIFDGDVVAGSIDGTIEMMREKLAASRQLLANAAALSAAGFSQTFIEQVVGAGTEVGNELAQGILNSTPEQQAEMRQLFNAIETEAQSGIDSLAKTIYEENGLATQELKNLYAQTEADLVTALAEQEAVYQEQIATINANFNQAIVDAAVARDEALAEAKDALQKALLEANEAWLADLDTIEKAFNTKISNMKGQVAGLASSISALNSSIDAAQSKASTAAATAAKAVQKKQPIKMATGGLVTSATNAIVGEAGPEVVIPLDRFESMMGLTEGAGKSLNYYAAPNQSIDSEQELFTAMKRAKVVVGW